MPIASNVQYLLKDVTTVSVGETFMVSHLRPQKTYQMWIEGTGVVSATVQLDCSNDGVHWMQFGGITLNATGSDIDGVPNSDNWAMVRAQVTAIAGTNAKVSCVMHG